MRRIATIFASVLTMFCCDNTFAQSTNPMANIDRLGRVMMYINNNYVDTVNFDRITDKAIKEVVNSLDPHSTFIPKEDVDDVNEPLEGNFEGVGIEFAIINDTLSVQSVIVGGPSEAVGLRAGDKIVEIDGENVASVGLSTEGVRKRLRGPKGTVVNLKVARRNVNAPLSFTIVRNTIPLNSIDAIYCPEPDILYVKLSRFAQSSAMELFQAFRMVQGYPKGIIIDLRGNGGGYLQVALMITKLFLSPGQLVLYTEGMRSPVHREYADAVSIYPQGPLAVLVDENSASASEIFAGALQDWDRGVVIGRRTFGKGLVQQQYTLSDGSQLRLTVARYHTPSGRVIQSPYEEGHRAEYYDKMNERFLHGEMFCRDSIVFPDSLKFKTLKLGRTIYGGGGIMPDVFIPIDTVGVNNLFSKIVGEGLLSEYTNIFCDQNREEIAAGGNTFEEFYSYYNDNLEKRVFDGLVDYCRNKNVSVTDSELSECENLLKVRLKALVAKSLFDLTAYYRVVNMECDPEFREAMKIVKTWSEPFPSL